MKIGICIVTQMTSDSTPGITRLTVLHRSGLFLLVDIIRKERVWRNHSGCATSWISTDGEALIHQMVKTACLQLYVILPSCQPDLFLKPYSNCF